MTISAEQPKDVVANGGYLSTQSMDSGSPRAFQRVTDHDLLIALSNNHTVGNTTRSVRDGSDPTAVQGEEPGLQCARDLHQFGALHLPQGRT